MGRAAEAVRAAARERWPDARRWVVLCGAGNNGGDGYVIARLARQSGLDVQVCALTDPGLLTGDAATAWRDVAAAGGTLVPFAPGLLPAAGLVVDAILGTGLARPVAGDFGAAIEAVNAAQRPVVAVEFLGSTRPRAARGRHSRGPTVTVLGPQLAVSGAGKVYAGVGTSRPRHPPRRRARRLEGGAVRCSLQASCPACRDGKTPR